MGSRFSSESAMTLMLTRKRPQTSRPKRAATTTGSQFMMLESAEPKVILSGSRVPRAHGPANGLVSDRCRLDQGSFIRRYA